MAVLTEVYTFCDLIVKATNFLGYIRDGWYKGSALLDEFPTKVAVLGAKQAQWTKQLQRHGMSEEEDLNRLVQLAVDILEKQDVLVEQLKQKKLLRWKRMIMFPDQLVHILNSVIFIVDAAPQMLKDRAESIELLQTAIQQTPSLLPFGPDPKYVPVTRNVERVKLALENSQGPPVVTLHGLPGIGKSSLAKYLGLHYQELQRSGKPRHGLCFPHGVFYLFCGKGAHSRVLQLQSYLLHVLGFGLGSSSSSEETLSTVTSSEQERDRLHKLRFCLAEQQLLLIFDDVWETELLEVLLTPAKGVKYLVTSQIKGIWNDAEKIAMQNPDRDSAREIIARCTDKFRADVEFPPDVQSVVDEIIGHCEYNPLALANVGVSINSKGDRANYIDGWEEVKDCLHEYFNDKCIFDTRPHSFGRMYPNSVGASMLLMIESLQGDVDACNLLYLLALCDSPWIPEAVVKFMFTCIQPKRSKYASSRDFLESRSLIESRLYTVHVRGDEEESEFWLSMHGLRRHYILEKKSAEVRSLARILMSGSREAFLGTGRDAEALIQDTRALIPVMASMYGGQALLEATVAKMQFNQSPSTKIDAVLWSGTFCRSEVDSLVWLLDDSGRGGWKQHAHGLARKVILRFITRGEVDDESMARLVELPQTTEAACLALFKIKISMFDCSHCLALFKSKISTFDCSHQFSTRHPQIMKSLVDLSIDVNADLPRRRFAVDILKLVAISEDLIIHEIIHELRNFLGEMTTNSDLVNLKFGIHLLSHHLFHWKFHSKGKTRWKPLTRLTKGSIYYLSLIAITIPVNQLRKVSTGSSSAVGSRVYSSSTGMEYFI